MYGFLSEEPEPALVLVVSFISVLLLVVFFFISFVDSFNLAFSLDILSILFPDVIVLPLETSTASPALLVSSLA